MSKHTILFLAANPLGTDRLALDEQARAIQAELERSGHRNHFELITRWATQPLDLLRELRKLKPTVVHFSGHGNRAYRQGLYFQGEDGQPLLVSNSALEETFSAAGSSVKLIVLAACYSDTQAEALRAHVDCVVGMGGSISDEAVRSFAIGFYGGLGESEPVAAAYRQGRAAINLEGLTDGEKPQLKVRDGVDAARLVVTEARSAVTDVGNATSQTRLVPVAAQLRSGQRANIAAMGPADTGASSGSGPLALKFTYGKYERAEVQLPKSGVTRIGRANGLEVVLLDDMTSRFHAKILISNSAINIEDQNSTHGTYVNGKRVTRITRLDVGDRILIGTSMMRLVDATGSGPCLEEARQQVENGKATHRKTISGVLEESPLIDILHMTTTSGKSGMLCINNGTSVGQIYLRKGMLYFAAINDDLTAPHQSLYRMLTWLTGTFELEPIGMIQVAEEMRESTDELLLEGKRQLDEFDHLRKQLPPPESPLAVPTPLTGKLHELSSSELEVFQLVLDHGQLQKVLDNFSGPHLVAARDIITLLKREFVVVPIAPGV